MMPIALSAALFEIEQLRAERDAARAERDAARAASEKDREWVGRALEKQAEHLGQSQMLVAERDAARAGEARAVEACQRIEEALQGTDFADHGLDSPVWNALELVRDVTADAPALDWLAQQRREAVAAWIEKEATKCRQQDGEYYERGVDCMLREAAALRAGEVADE